ncbi:hypothetical protein MHH28_09475 [Paenibacillus sp. FSL K6-1217]|uniref:hypothetical protein n=1 Tax=Paenibacillus sp. FSL K6-1217 TaxID=2921466 RepID=UPI0032518068
MMKMDRLIALIMILLEHDGYDRLLTFGDKCEVLGPPEIRSGSKACVRGIMRKYEGE